jgi:hypothetical protein
MCARQALYHLSHSASPFCFGYLFFLAALEFELRASHLLGLLGMCSYCLSHSASLFCDGFFRDRVS